MINYVLFKSYNVIWTPPISCFHRTSAESYPGMLIHFYSVSVLLRTPIHQLLDNLWASLSQCLWWKRAVSKCRRTDVHSKSIQWVQLEQVVKERIKVRSFVVWPFSGCGSMLVSTATQVSDFEYNQRLQSTDIDFALKPKTRIFALIKITW